MTVYLKRSVDGTVSEYAPMPIWESPEFVKSLPHARESFDQPHAYVGYDDQGRQWINGRKGAPTREEWIQGWMAYPIHTPTKNKMGWSVMGEPHWPTRAEAEAKVDRLYPDLKPQMETEAAA